jgi:hypothetical protein
MFFLSLKLKEDSQKYQLLERILKKLKQQQLLKKKLSNKK